MQSLRAHRGTMSEGSEKHGRTDGTTELHRERQIPGNHTTPGENQGSEEEAGLLVEQPPLQPGGLGAQFDDSHLAEESSADIRQK